MTLPSPNQESSIPTIPSSGTSALRSVFSNWIGLGLTSITSLILTPLLIHRLGSFYFGLWILVGSVTDYYGLLDIGMRATLFRFVTRFKGGDDRIGLNETMSSAVAIVCTIATLVLLLTILMLPWVPDFFGVTRETRFVFEKLMLLLGFTIAVLFPGQLFGTYLCAMRRFDLFNLSSSSANVLKLALIVGSLNIGGGVIGVAVATLITAIFSLGLNTYLMFKIDPELRLTFSRVRRTTIKSLLSFSIFSFLISIGDYLRFFTDSIVIGRVLSVGMITPFSVATRLITLLRQLLTGVSAPLQGTMGELEGARNYSELNKFVLRSLRTTGVLTAVCVALLATNGEWLIRRWIGQGFNVSYQILLILLLGYLVAMAQQPFADLLLIKGRHQLRGWWSVAEGVGNLVLSIWWGRKYGLIGVALGTSVPMLLVQIAFQPWYAIRVSRLRTIDYFRVSVLPPLAAFLFATGSCYALRMLNPSTMSADFALLMVEIIVTTVVGWVALGSAERDYLLQRLGLA